MLQRDGMRGIIYKDPAQGYNKTENLEILVKKRSSASKNLYSVLNSNANIFHDKDEDDIKEKQKVVKEIINNFSSIFKKIFEKTHKLDNYKEVSSYITKNIKKVKMDVLKYESNEKLAKDIVSTAIRNSLRKNITWHEKRYYLPDIAEKLLLAIIINADVKEYEKIPQEEVLAFINYINIDKTNSKSRIKDGKKITHQKDVITSIKKQNVKVQVFDKDGEKMLMLSNSNHPRKSLLQILLKILLVVLMKMNKTR